MNTRESFDTYQPQLPSGEETCSARVTAYLAAIDARRGLNAYLSVFHDEALAQARAVDEKIKNGTAGPLAGMVVSIKDVLCMKGTATTCGSKILEHHEALYDATVVERLRAADAVIIGKTNMD